MKFIAEEDDIMEKDYYLLGEILWGMKDYFISPSEEEIETKDFNRVDDCEIDLGSFDGLSDCRVTIGKGNFCFRTGNYSATPQYERDKRRFFITCGYNIDDNIRFFYEVPDENILETLKKIITIKISKKLLHNSHQQMIENSGVLNISDIANITYTLLAKGVYYIDNNEILEQKNKKEEKGQTLLKKRIPTKK